MRIDLSPQVRADRLSLRRKGDTLTINDEHFDFAPLGDGEILPRAAINSIWLASDVRRIDGQIHLTIILPLGYDAPESSRFPTPIVDPPDGTIELPPYSAE